MGAARWAATGLVLYCMAVVVSPAAAQSGALTGVVADETGAVLPGATVTLSGGPAGPRETQTDAAGRFRFPGLAPGTYRLSVFLSGFGEVTVAAVAVAADPVELPAITLRLASFDEAVVVTATRIEEPLQQVPMSISAVTGADIERRAIGNPDGTVALDARPDGGRSGRPRQQRGHRARAPYRCAERVGAGGQQLQQRRRHLPRGHSARGRPPPARHRAGGGAAGTARDAVRGGNAGRGGALPPAAPGYRGAHVRGPGQPVRPGAQRRGRFRRRFHVQPAAGGESPGGPRLGRPVRRPRVHRLRLSAADPRRLRAGAGPDRSGGGRGEPPPAAGCEHRGDAFGAALVAVASDAEPVGARGVPPAGSARGRAADQSRSRVRHRTLRLRPTATSSRTTAGTSC